MVCFFLVILCLRKRWFYSEPGHNNPYKMVGKVLNFSRKHKYPLQRSAFTYSGEEDPSRIDYAKERYGGPFTTEQVEDVKTFFRILIVLLALGLLFVLEIPASIFVSILFGLHTGGHSAVAKQICNSEFILFGKGSMINIVTVLVLPVYIKLVFSTLYQRVPRIFSRLIIAVSIYFLGVTSMLCIDLAGHISNIEEIAGNKSMCIRHRPWYCTAKSSLALRIIAHSQHSSWNRSTLGHGYHIRVHLSSESFLHERSFTWSVLQYQGFLPACQWSSFDTILLQTSMGQSVHERASFCHQLWFWLPSLHLCCWPYPVISVSQEVQVQGER